eukprot:Gb_02758 [translate_table: standard]
MSLLTVNPYFNPTLQRHSFTVTVCSYSHSCKNGWKQRHKKSHYCKAWNNPRDSLPATEKMVSSNPSNAIFSESFPNNWEEPDIYESEDEDEFSDEEEAAPDLTTHGFKEEDGETKEQDGELELDEDTQQLIEVFIGDLKWPKFLGIKWHRDKVSCASGFGH